MLCTEIQCVFLLNPKMFVKKFLEDFDFERLEKTFPYLHEDEHKLPLPLIVTNTLSERLMSTGLLEDTMKNKVKLTVAISCITEPFIQMREEADLICEIAGVWLDRKMMDLSTLFSYAILFGKERSDRGVEDNEKKTVYPSTDQTKNREVIHKISSGFGRRDSETDPYAAGI